MVLVTACFAETPREGVDFLPLTVDYEERLYAAGKIPGGFIRREGRPSQEATLTARLTDRSIRPLLPKTWRNEIQIVVTTLSADQENDLDTLALIGASAALTLSEIPFTGPVAMVRIGRINDQFVLNPTMAEVDNGQLDLVVASTRQAIVMIEAGASEVSEAVITEAIKSAHEANQAIIRLQEEMRAAIGKPKRTVPVAETNPELHSAISPIAGERLAAILAEADKAERDAAIQELGNTAIENLPEQFPEADIFAAIDDKIKQELRSSILEKGQRLGNRGLTEIRPLSCEVGLLPRTHGSALFSRGLTQVLSITTLGPVGKEQQLDGLGIEESKRFIHHYNFPKFSNGEVGRIGSTSRREIGHGALAERALLPVLPASEEFPYTIRIVSEVLSSSGSTSMASTCASSLSMMDAGIPVKAAVAGIAMGLVTDDKGNYAVLTDIEGIEDAYGDMDFKVAGTAQGITALQLDIKLQGISLEIIQAALEQSRQARLTILETMQQTISQSRPEVSKYAPRMYKISIDPSKIGAVIGTGGKTIRSIIEETKTTIDIDNDGTVVIGSPDEAAAHRAIELIEGLTKEAEIGAIYTGKVVRITSFGAFVEILPGKDGMVHISELADYRVARVEDEVKLGDEITVKVIDIDDAGRVRLSRRAVFAKSEPTRGSRNSEPLDPNYPFRTQQQQRRSSPPRSRQDSRPRHGARR